MIRLRIVLSPNGLYGVILKKSIRRNTKLLNDIFFVLLGGSHSGRDGTARFVLVWQKGKVSDAVKKLTINVGTGAEGVRE